MPSAGRPAGGKNKKARTLFPASRFSKMLRKGSFSPRISKNAGSYMAATCGYLVHELLELTCKGVGSAKGKGKRLTPRHLNIAIRSDEELAELLKDVNISGAGVIATDNSALTAGKKVAKKAGKKTKKAAKVEKAAAKKATKKAAPKKKGLSKQDSTTIGGVTIGGATLTRTQSGKVEELARAGALTHKWQYQNDAGNFQDYDVEASGAVEMAYASWVIDSHIDVRSVASGDWEYMVDFNLVQQQNVKHSAHKVRKIRRQTL
eukprot:161289_1